MKTLSCILILCAGCAPRTPIDRAALLNKQMTAKAATVSQFAKYSPDVESEQSQLADAAAQEKRDIGLVHDCLRDRGGIKNPICRADWNVTNIRLDDWVQASANRAMDDVNHSPKASERAKRKARKQFTTIQTKAQKTFQTLDQGGLLVKRHSTAHPPAIPHENIPTQNATTFRPNQGLGATR